MDESLGAQYAIQIAVHTLRDRCKSLQQRVGVLEEENMNLRILCTRNEQKEHSLSEVDKLKEDITQLTEQKEQLQNKFKMVSGENQELWNKLGKLTTVNKNLGQQLSKINDTVNQHTLAVQPQIPLIRSKTFTQDEPHTKFLQKNLEINEKISLELEDISLKISDSFSKQKKELDKLCSEIEGIQYSDNIILQDLGFCYEEELEEDLIEEVKYLFDDLKTLRQEVLHQKGLIDKNFKNLNNLQAKSMCKICDMKRNSNCEKGTSTIDIPKCGNDKSTETVQIDEEKTLKSVSETLPPEVDKICPMCTKVFRKDVDFTEFQHHVEDHFLPDVESYEIL